ncbi:RDD family protein [Akkermansiaceae bacterium]|nr:RDD family protein [Akkermansiaceae bacterium]
MRRLAAVLIDGLVKQFIIMIPIIVIVLITAPMITRSIEAADSTTPPEPSPVIIILGLIIYLVVTVIFPWLYFAIMESSSKQGTLGKMALGIVVTDMNGQRISFGKATGRYFAKIISGMILFIGYLMYFGSDKGQCLHDMMANCLVQKR